MKDEARVTMIRVHLDARPAVRALEERGRRLRAGDSIWPLPVLAGIDWCVDEEQDIRARNLMTVRALPCERE